MALECAQTLPLSKSHTRSVWLLEADTAGSPSDVTATALIEFVWSSSVCGFLSPRVTKMSDPDDRELPGHFPLAAKLCVLVHNSRSRANRTFHTQTLHCFLSELPTLASLHSNNRVIFERCNPKRRAASAAFLDPSRTALITSCCW
jgi:hypothetical protein